jgi:hypothetical protein
MEGAPLNVLRKLARLAGSSTQAREESAAEPLDPADEPLNADPEKAAEDDPDRLSVGFVLRRDDSE